MNFLNREMVIDRLVQSKEICGAGFFLENKALDVCFVLIPKNPKKGIYKNNLTSIPYLFS
jgi:hypothetical protein